MAGGQVQMFLIWLTALAGYTELRTRLRPGRRQAMPQARRSEPTRQRRPLALRAAAPAAALTALTALSVGLAVTASAVLPGPAVAAATERHRVPSYYSGTPGGGNGDGTDSPGTVVAGPWQIRVRKWWLAPKTGAGMTRGEWNRLLRATYEAMEQHPNNEIGDVRISLADDSEDPDMGVVAVP